MGQRTTKKAWIILPALERKDIITFKIIIICNMFSLVLKGITDFNTVSSSALRVAFKESMDLNKNPSGL